MSRSPRIALSGAACAAALAMALAGCGSKDDEGDPIPRDVASAISQELTSVQKRLDYANSHPTPGGEGACNDIEDDSFPRIESELARVPDGVKKDVRDALTESVDNLQALTRSDCEKVSQKAGEPDTTPTEPTTPEEAPAPETPTVPQDTTPTTPTTPDKQKEPKEQLPGQGDEQPGTGGGGAGAPVSP